MILNFNCSTRHILTKQWLKQLPNQLLRVQFDNLSGLDRQNNDDEDDDDGLKVEWWYPLT